MGLKTDFEEVTQYWGRAPWRVRVVLVLVFFISTTSLASLSESVIKWKGFIFDALTFYREYILRPIVEVVQRLIGHPLPIGFVDNAVFYGLFFAALTRALLLRNSSLKKRIADFAFIGASYATMLWLIFDSRESPNAPTIWVLYPMFLLCAYLITKGGERVLAMAYMLIPVFGVGILAAISAGLAR